MGYQLFNAIEIHRQESPFSLMKELGNFEGTHGSGDHFFRAYHQFQYDQDSYLHVSWNAADEESYALLKHFAHETGRAFFTHYRELSHLPLLKVSDLFHRYKSKYFLSPIWAIEKKNWDSSAK